MIEIIVDENIPGIQSMLPSDTKLTYVNGRSLSREHLGNAQALLVRSITQVNEQLLDGSNIAFVGSATSGIDHIDRNYLHAKGIEFVNAAGANANSVVEYVLAAIAEVEDHLEGLFLDKTVGIVGYGNIGKALSNRLDALGINHGIYDPWLDQSQIPHAMSLPQILGCNVVALHCELTREQPYPSYHLLGATELAMLNAKQLLINGCRGPVVDNEALLQRFTKPDAPKVVLDVWEHEPNVSKALLDKVTLGTAHIAGYSYDGKLLASKMLCESLIQHFQLPSPLVKEAQGKDDVRLELSSEQRVSKPGLLRSLIKQRYNIVEDDKLLRAAVNDNEQKTALRFDQLRKHYAIRWELKNSSVDTSNFEATNSETVRHLLASLDCKPLMETGKS